MNLCNHFVHRPLAASALLMLVRAFAGVLILPGILTAQTVVAPTLVSPPDSSVNLPATVQLVWTAVPATGNYEVQISSAPDFVSSFLVDSTVADTSALFGPLPNNTFYFWRVRSTTLLVSGSWSSVWHFTTAPAVPAPPALVSPGNGTTGVPMNTLLTWGLSPGATGYHLQVATDSTFATTLVDRSNLTSTSDSVNGLANSTTYYWRVSAANSSGVSPWSGISSFTTVASPPQPPSLLSPADGASGVSTNPTLQWNASTAASSYRVQVSTDTGFSTPVVDQAGLSSTSTVVNGLHDGTTYYWRVNASNGSGTSAWSPMRSFATAIGVPAPPLPVSPPNGASNQPLTIRLAWNLVPSAARYHLQISQNAQFSSIAIEDSTIADTFFVAGPLSSGTSYWWRVSASNAGGTGGWSSAWSFTTTPPPPPAPVLASPADGATGVARSPVLSWNASSGASAYHLQVSTLADFSTLAADDSGLTQLTQQVGPLAYNTLHYWRVSAANAYGASPWSAVWSFATTTPPPAAPALVSPASGSTNVAITPTLTWNASPGASRYHLQVSADSGFALPDVDRDSLTATTASVSGLGYGTTYYWRLNASNASGTSAWSAAWSFTTIPPAPPSPALVSPPDSTTGVPVDLTLHWRASPQAFSYALQVSTTPSFTILVANVPTIDSTSYAISGLSHSTVYYWRVSATGTGGTSGWSAAWTFTTIESAPVVPSPVSPLNGAIDEPTDMRFLWRSVPGAISYRLQVSMNTSFSSPTTDQSPIVDTAYNVAGLARGTTYYWRVTANNSAGTSGWSNVWNFSTLPNAPAVPALASPPDQSTSEPTTISLSWTASQGALTYHLQVSASPTFATNIVDDSTITATSSQVRSLASSTTYYWRVSATNDGGTSSWPAPWRFTTGSAVQPTGPDLVSPPDGSTGLPATVTLQWNSLVTATSYEVQVSLTASFSALVTDSSGLGGTSMVLGALQPGTAYYWRVRGIVVAAPTQWSAVWSFTTLRPPPVAPVLSSPSDGSANEPTTLALAWNASQGAASYHLQVSSSNSFTPMVLDDSAITVTSATVDSLARNVQYHWRVRARNDGGWSPFSATWSFRTVATGGPSAATDVASNIGSTSATVHATVNPNGATLQVQFQYGPTSAYGDSAAASPPTVSGTTAVAVSSTLQNLAPNSTYHYRIAALDSVGSIYGQDMTFTTGLPAYPSTFTANPTVYFPDRASPSDYQSADYRLIGIPGASGKPVTGFLRGIQNRDWQLYWDNGSPTGGLVAYNGGPEFTFTAGAAFWLVHKGVWSIDTIVPSAPLNSTGEVEIPLHAGWNLIANPFTNAIPWARIQQADSITEPIYTFNGSFSISTSFNSCTGYYFFNSTNLPVLKVPYGAAISQNPPVSSPPTPSSWELQIVLSGSGILDHATWLGVSPHVAPGRNRLDYHKPRGVGQLPEVTFSRPEWDAVYSSFATDIRPPIQAMERWRFDVNCQNSGELRLDFKRVQWVPEQYEVYLISENNGAAFDLRADSSYTFTPVSNVSHFSIIVGRRDSVRNLLMSLPMARKFALGRNYPNPFNPSTTIPVDIPTRSRIELAVYTILGEKVQTLYAGWIESGIHEFRWEGKNQRGVSLPTGAYICRLTTNTGASSTRTMILLR